MVWSPSQSGNMIVSAYRYTYWTDRGEQVGIAFQWGYSDPFNYDKWLIRLDRNGANQGQWDCWSNTWPYPCTRTSGSWGWAPVAAGYAYRIVVEGCDVDPWGGHTCRQGWTIPVWLF